MMTRPSRHGIIVLMRDPPPFSNKSLMPLQLVIITPVFNDWESFNTLVRDVARALTDLNCEVEIIAVDDCSSDRAPSAIAIRHPIHRVSTLRLAANMGHQRAIAIGLSSIVARNDLDLVAVMDSDGEDRPTELRRMIDTALGNPQCTVLAQRAKRSEGILFRVFYRVYVGLFRLLTGHSLNFGNFCILPFAHLDRLVSRADIWNNFAATIICARLPMKLLPTVRGCRYAGQSKMNFVSLIVHGFGAMSVFSDIVFTRILFATSILLVAVTLGLCSVVGIRLLTDLAIPGWTTNIFGILVLIGINAVMLTVMMAFLQFGRRSSVQQAPREFAMDFVRENRDLISGDLIVDSLMKKAYK
jgi:glycosyltransferase involved in cell wall biosynthesis